MYYITDSVNTATGEAKYIAQVNQAQLDALLEANLIYENTIGDPDGNPYIGPFGSTRHFHPMHDLGKSMGAIIDMLEFSKLANLK